MVGYYCRAILSSCRFREFDVALGFFMCRMGVGKLQDVCMREGERSLALCLCGGESAPGCRSLLLCNFVRFWSQLRPGDQSGERD